MEGVFQELAKQCRKEDVPGMRSNVEFWMERQVGTANGVQRIQSRMQFRRAVGVGMEPDQGGARKSESAGNSKVKTAGINAGLKLVFIGRSL